MAVDLAMERARSSKNLGGLRLDGDISLDSGLVQQLVEECRLDALMMDKIYDEISDMFAARPRRARPRPTLHSAQLIREYSNCPSGIQEDVVGLLDVGLVHHNAGAIQLAVATYLQACHAWIKHLPKTHTEAQVIIFCLCAIGGVLESDQGATDRDPVALTIYMLAAEHGEREAPGTIELALAQSCVGCACFHLQVFDRALEYFQKASLIRTTLAIEDELPGHSVTPEELATVYNNMGACYASIDENVQAQEQYKKAYHIFREHCGAGHVYTACVNRNIEKTKYNVMDHHITEIRPTKPIYRKKDEKKKKGGKKKKKK